MRILLLIFVFASLGNAQGNEYDITSLFRCTYPCTAEIPLRGGSVLTFKTPIQKNYSVKFIDLVPNANWSHPALYRMVSLSGTIEEIRSSLPPRDWKSTEVGPAAFAIQTFNGKFKIADPSHFHAVFISGQSEVRHWNDFSFLYRVLTQVYGYRSQNIWIADSTNKTESPDLDGDGEMDIHFGSSLSDIKNLFQKLKQTLTPEDQVFLVVNDHGKMSNGESTLLFPDGEMGAKEFVSLLKDLSLKSLIAVYGQCFGGGFVRPTADKNRVAMAAATDREYSWTTLDLKFDEFLYRLTSAFAMQTHEGVPVASDANSDGWLSIKEAFSYALREDTRPENPLLESLCNTCSSKSLGIAPPPNP